MRGVRLSATTPSHLTRVLLLARALAAATDEREGARMATMVTWYSEMLADVDSLLMLVDQIGAHDDRNRPYRDVAAELRADEFIPVQKAVADLANRVHSARESVSVDEGIVYEAMGLLVDLIPYMRYACRTRCSARC